MANTDTAVRLIAPDNVRLPISGPAFSRPNPELVNKLDAVSSATASAELHKLGIRQTYIQGPLPRTPGRKIVGSAVTLQLPTYFIDRGGIGMVVDGCVRDWPKIQELGLAMWTRGFTPNYVSQTTLFPWAYNVPIACSRVLVLPGDIIIADDDGAVCIPVKMAPQFAEHTLEHEDWETFSRMKLAQGGALKKYYPLNDEGRREYEEWQSHQ
jgi:regulator of RNase E activity RraA